MAGGACSPSQDSARRPLAASATGEAELLDRMPHHVAGIGIVLDHQHRTLAPDQAMDQRRQPRPVDRLGQDIDGAERKADAAIRSHGDHDHRNVAELGVGLERAQHLPAVGLGHHHVERDRIRTDRCAPDRAPRRRSPA